jgi:hypothetical protein
MGYMDKWSSKMKGQLFFQSLARWATIFDRHYKISLFLGWVARGWQIVGPSHYPPLKVHRGGLTTIKASPNYLKSPTKKIVT